MTYEEARALFKERFTEEDKKAVLAFASGYLMAEMPATSAALVTLYEELWPDDPLYAFGAKL